ncbi:MAG TPA: hypothetical protein VJQ44_10620 [Gemmatimonadales bacterium]|nr:hypothetical protein [Gemmatimonadales bacterium]
MCGSRSPLLRPVPQAVGLAWILLLGQGCKDDTVVGPQTGDIVVTVTTSGEEPDPDGYALSLDGRQGVAIGSAATRTLTVDAGRHELKLSGLAGNCRAGGDGPSRTVSVEADATVQVLFAIECSATAGGIRVIVTSSGNVTDPDGYAVVLDAEAPRPVGIEDTLELTALAVGEHQVHLAELADVCSVTGGDVQTVTVAAGVVVDVHFEVVCHAGIEQWTEMESGSAADLADVWGTSAADVFAVGELDTDDENGFQIASMILHYDGTAWSLQRRVRDVSLRGVWAHSSSDAWAVGFDFFDDDARVLHWDGTQWISQDGFTAGPQESIGLFSVWGSAGNDVFAVGSTFDGQFGTSLIFHFDGASWERVTVPGDALPSLADVWGSGPTDVFAVGLDQRVDPTEGTVLHYDGTGWTRVYHERGLNLTTVWGTSASDVFAAGFTVREENEDFIVAGAIRHFDGSGWTTVPIPETGVLNELWGSSATDVYAVGDDGVILHYDGTGWTATHPTGQTLLGIWGPGAAEAFATGNAGTILHGTP